MSINLLQISHALRFFTSCMLGAPVKGVQVFAALLILWTALLPDLCIKSSITFQQFVGGLEDHLYESAVRISVLNISFPEAVVTVGSCERHQQSCQCHERSPAISCLLCFFRTQNNESSEPQAMRGADSWRRNCCSLDINLEITCWCILVCD